MVLHALRQEILPADGVEFATSLKLTPQCFPVVSLRHEFVTRVLCNVVVARSNILRVFEVREEPAPVQAEAEDERDRRSMVRRGTGAVEGEVVLDQAGDGFINIGKSMLQKAPSHLSTVTRFYLVREHRLHGIVTGMEGVKILSSFEDNLDRLLISFKDAKIALLEWSEAIADLVTVSIHTYERAPQLLALDSPLFRAELRVDSLSRCAALSLPKHAFAILPFAHGQAELDIMDQEQSPMRDIPYSPSFILDLPAQVDPNLRNIIDFVFLPGFTNPTLAVLFQPQLTWTGRLKELKDTVKLVIFTLDLNSRMYPIITFVDGLPHDCLSLLPCPPSLGGVVITTGNALIYIDQASRRIVLPLNGWTARMSDIPLPPADPNVCLLLEGSRATFVDDKSFFLVLKDGTIYRVEVELEGKVVSRLVLSKPLARSAIPSVAKCLNEDHFFIGSTVGPSVLLKAEQVEEEVDDDAMDTATTTIVGQGDAMDDDDDDDDIYGSSKAAENPRSNGLNNLTKVVKTRTVLHLSIRDALNAHGPITSMTFSLAHNGDRHVPELVTTTGVGHVGGFTLFQRDLPTVTKRKIHAIGGARGLWSLPIRQSVKTSGGGVSYEKAAGPNQTENDTLIFSTDAIPSPGTSRIATRSSNKDVSITTRMTGTTIGVAPFFQRTAILHVMTNVIKVLEPDGSERQAIRDMDGNVPRAKIRACSILDPFVFILREDDTIGLFIGETERGKIRRKDMSPMGDKASRYIAGSFFVDTTGLFESQFQANVSPTIPASTTLQGAAGSKTQWLLLVRPQGVMEIWTLPKLSLAFSTSGISTLQNVLSDSQDPPALSLPQEQPRKPQDFDVENITVAPIGENSPRPHLCVFLRCGQLTVYEICPLTRPIPLEPHQEPSSEKSKEVEKTRSTHLDLVFVKVSSIAFEIHRQDENEKSILAEHKRIFRTFVPFVTTPEPGVTYSGVFLTGDRPNWILSGNQSGLQIYPSGHSVVHAFTPCSLWESKAEFLMYTEEGPCLLQWVSDFKFNGPLPSRFIPRGRSYSNVLFDPSTSLIVAASSLQAKFASYDEDGNCVWEPDAPNVADPTCECSALELISPDYWVTLDGFEFANNEYVNDMAIVTLETAGTETGTKDFIVVGTTIDRGEDLAARGVTYIFEISEVVPDPELAPSRWYRLRLRCRDDAKGPVTAVCGFSGYVVSSMGQKVFVRAFDSDERLVGVAFMDVGVYVTSLRTMKNLLLVGDAVKSVMFVAFQEDPYKLVLVSKDTKECWVTCADFFFTESELAIVTGDEEGILRVYEYNPEDPDAKANGGRYLLLRTEFHGQSEYRCSTTIARRPHGSDGEIAQAKLLMASPDGSLSSLTPVDEDAYKRLQLLQGQLTRNIQHTAGLNPKVFRIVKNESVSRPLTKGILDGNLLAQYESLPITRQNEMTRQIGTERMTVLRDWIYLTGPW